MPSPDRPESHPREAGQARTERNCLSPQGEFEHRPQPAPPHPGATAGVVLAAGSSTRMGRNKLLLDLNGEPLVRRAVRAAVEAGLDPVVVVLGHEAERVREALAGLPCTPVVNPRHAEGVRTSLQLGVSRAQEAGAGALVVILADMPRVTATMIGDLVERYRCGDAPLVVSRYGEVEAPPTLYDRSLFGELLALDEGPGCAKRVVRRHLHEAAVLAWPEAALQDVDVAEDYARVISGVAGVAESRPEGG